jgi:hypothetical protein
MIYLTTPAPINESTELLIKRLPAPGKPVFLDLRAEPFAQIAECYGNVATKIAKDGGDVQHGWCVWVHEGRLIEGEFHAIWVSPQGELVDITPKRDGEERILFIPDKETVYDNKHIDNVRVALTDDAEVKGLIRDGEKKSQLRARYDNGNGLSQIPIHAIAKSIMDTGRNEPCPCGSGSKYKRCCWNG